MHRTDTLVRVRCDDCQYAKIGPYYATLAASTAHRRRHGHAMRYQAYVKYGDEVTLAPLTYPDTSGDPEF